MPRRQQPRKQKPGKRSTRSKKSAAPREPWTPWGKWAKARKERIERRQREQEKRREQRRRARQLRRLRRRRLAARGGIFLGLLGLACGIGFLVLMVLGRPYPWEALRDVTKALQLSQTLAESRERWENLAIRHYTVEVEYTAHQVRCGPVTLEVRGGEIVRSPRPDQTHWFPREVCDSLAGSLTIEGAFDWLDRQTQQFQPGRTYLHAEFDPGFGYLTYVEVGVYGDERPPDCCWTVTWRNLRLLND